MPQFGALLTGVNNAPIVIIYAPNIFIILTFGFVSGQS
jgi:hypothetical protein